MNNTNPEQQSTERILIVDDMADCRHLLHEFLKRKISTTIEYQVADSGMQAAGCLWQFKYSLVISDHNMNNGCGFWLYHFMRQFHPQIPLLIFTAHPESFRGEIDSTLKAIVPKNDIRRLLSEVEKVRH